MMKILRMGVLAMFLPLLGCSPDYPDAPIDPLAMARSQTDNDALSCPVGECVESDAESRVFAVPAAELFAAWQSVIADAPRTRIVALDADRGLIHAEQRSAIFHFVDTILIRIEAVEGGSSYIALSRSELGRSDFGVNAERLQNWARALQERVSEG